MKNLIFSEDFFDSMEQFLLRISQIHPFNPIFSPLKETSVLTVVLALYICFKIPEYEKFVFDY
jgi:hypothetical protein